MSKKIKVDAGDARRLTPTSPPAMRRQRRRSRRRAPTQPTHTPQPWSGSPLPSTNISLTIALVALLLTGGAHVFIWWVLPDLKTAKEKNGPEEISVAVLPPETVNITDIQPLLLPKELRPPSKPQFVQVNPDAAPEMPPETNNHGAANQRAAQPDATAAIRSSTPKLDGEDEESSRITNAIPRQIAAINQPIPGFTKGQRDAESMEPPAPTAPPAAAEPAAAAPTPPPTPTPPPPAPEPPPRQPIAALPPAPTPTPQPSAKKIPDPQPPAPKPQPKTEQPQVTAKPKPPASKAQPELAKPTPEVAQASKAPTLSDIGKKDTVEKPPPLAGTKPVNRLPEEKPRPKKQEKLEEAPMAQKKAESERDRQKSVAGITVEAKPRETTRAEATPAEPKVAAPSPATAKKTPSIFSVLETEIPPEEQTRPEAPQSVETKKFKETPTAPPEKSPPASPPPAPAKKTEPPKPEPQKPKPTPPAPKPQPTPPPAPAPTPPQKFAPISRAPSKLGDNSDLPAPLPRPQISKAGTTGPLLRNLIGTGEAGTLALDAKFSDFGEYSQGFLEQIQAHWWSIIQRIGHVGGGAVVISYTLRKDGTIHDVRIEQSSASSAAAYACKDAIESCSPCWPWTESMVKLLGDEMRSSCTFYYK